MKILREYRVLSRGSGYLASSDGFIYTLRRGWFKRIKSIPHYRGYLQATIYDETNKQHTYRVNRLIYESFNGEIPKGMQVNHLDEDKHNNAIENLNVLTPKENSNWGTRNKRLAKMLSEVNKGKIPVANPPKPVNQYTLDGEYVKSWSSIAVAARELGLNNGHISLCCNGKRKKTGGFIWRFAD